MVSIIHSLWYSMAFFYKIFIAKVCFIVFFLDSKKRLRYIVPREKLNRGLTDQRTIKKRINIRISQERLHVLVISIFFLNDCSFCLTTDEVNILE